MVTSNLLPAELTSDEVCLWAVGPGSGAQSLNSPLMTTSRNLVETNWQQICAMSKKHCSRTGSRWRRPEQTDGAFRRFNSVAFLSRVCLWAVPPLPGTGHSNTGGERKLKQPLFGRQLEAVSKTAVDSQIGASWTGLEAVYGQCPLPGTGHSKRGSESLNSLSLSLSVSSASGRYRQQMGHDGSNVG